MAKSIKQKEEALAHLEAVMPKAQSMVFVDYTGISVEEATILRKKAKAEGAEYLVAKKTLIKKAAEKAGLKDLDFSALTGNVAIIFGMTDPISPAKIAHDFAKTSEHLKILAGVMDNNYLAKSAVMQLAILPSKQQLYQMLVGTLSAPIASFARVLSGIADKAGATSVATDMAA